MVKNLVLCCLLVLGLLSGEVLAQRGPNKKERRRRQLQRAEGLDPTTLTRAHLTFNRLMTAQAVSNANLSITELDRARALFEEVRTWMNTQGPFWNNANTQAVAATVEDGLKFVEIRLQAEFGLVADLNSRLDYFLERDYPDGQKLALLLFATDSQRKQGQLEAAEQAFTRAQQFAEGMTEVSPVLKYAIHTISLQLRYAKGQRLSKEELLAGFDQAIEPLKTYEPKVNPLVDVHWLMARNITPFWAEQLPRLGDDGVSRLVAMKKAFKRFSKSQFKKWDNQKLKAQGIKPEYARPLKDFVEKVLMSSFTDINLLLVESFPPTLRAEKLKSEELNQLTLALDGAAALEAFFVNKKLPVEYHTYPLTRNGLVPEMQGRVRLLRAELEPSVATKIGLYDEGWQYIQKSDDVVAKLGYALKLAEVYSDELKRPEQAEKILRETIKTSEDGGLIGFSIRASAQLAQLHAKAEDWPKASAQAKFCLQEIEKAIPLTGGQSSQAFELQKVSSDMSSVLAQSALAQNDTATALSALSQGHSYETAVSQLSANKEAAEDLKQVKQKKQKVALLSQKVKQLKALPASETRDNLLADSEKLLAATRSDFLVESRRIRQEHSDLYSSVLRFDPLNLPDIQGSLDEDTTVIQFFPTESELFLFLVTKDSLKLKSVKLSKLKLDQMCRGFTHSLSRLAPLSKVITQSQALYQNLIEPLEEDLGNTKRLVIIPSGSLNFLPFGALYDGEKKPLIQKFSFLELAQPTDFYKIAQSKPVAVSSVTAFANATLDLPATVTEGEKISKLFDGANLYVGDKATKERFLQQSNKQQALHLATHGYWDTQNSLNNYLALAKGERVAQEEILSLALQNTALVTLSACNTAVANDTESDYVASLAEAFWLAGCPTVVASLWAVEDRSTATLMAAFYSGLKEGKSKVSALRDAQLGLLKTPEFEHPTYWSGFVLFGDWR